MFRLVIGAWTLLGWVWMLYDTIVKPDNWYNFTSWTWFLQTLLYTLYFFAKSSDFFIFLDAYVLPIVWSCEWAAAIAVVYMMVDESGAIENSLAENGPVLTWVGNFLIHYVTVIILLVYMHHDPKRIFTCTKSARENDPGRLVCLNTFLFTLTYAYASFFPPASHYGIAGITDTATALLLLAVSAIGLAVFQNWSS
jgi:hypothetical protein